MVEQRGAGQPGNGQPGNVQAGTGAPSAAGLLDHVLILRGPLPPGGLGLLPHETRFYDFHIANRDRLRLGDATAQFGQDLWVAWLLDCWNTQSPSSRKGYFVEFGAFDGVTHSNTHLLEKRFKWTGILAEPLPAFAARAKKARSAIVDRRCVWTKSGERLLFNAVPGAEELGTLKDFESGDLHAGRRTQGASYIEVETVSLGDLLGQYKAPPVIDYMSIDTEGSELAILEAHDFSRWRPRVLSVEHNWTAARDRVAALLSARGYRRLARSVDYCDDLFLDAALAAAVGV